jgi:hypothetical protein
MEILQNFWKKYLYLSLKNWIHTRSHTMEENVLCAMKKRYGLISMIKMSRVIAIGISQVKYVNAKYVKFKGSVIKWLYSAPFFGLQ